MTRVTILGTGGWGTALAALLATKGHETTQWGRTPQFVREMAEARENRPYLPGVMLPESLRLEVDLSRALSGAEAVVVVVPAQAVRQLLESVRPHLSHAPLLISCSKGLERGSHRRMTEVVGECLSREVYRGVVALSGPNHAEEVGRGIPSATVVASASPESAREAQDLFMA